MSTALPAKPAAAAAEAHSRRPPRRHISPNQRLCTRNSRHEIARVPNKLPRSRSAIVMQSLVQIRHHQLAHTSRHARIGHKRSDRRANSRLKVPITAAIVIHRRARRVGHSNAPQCEVGAFRRYHATAGISPAKTTTRDTNKHSLIESTKLYAGRALIMHAESTTTLRRAAGQQWPPASQPPHGNIGTPRTAC